MRTERRFWNLGALLDCVVEMKPRLRSICFKFFPQSKSVPTRLLGLLETRGNILSHGSSWDQIQSSSFGKAVQNWSCYWRTGVTSRHICNNWCVQSFPALITQFHSVKIFRFWSIRPPFVGVRKFPGIRCGLAVHVNKTGDHTWSSIWISINNISAYKQNKENTEVA